MPKSLYMQRSIVLAVAVIATHLTTPTGRTEQQNPVPRLSQSQNNPAARDQLISQMPSLSAEPARLTRQLSQPPVRGTWQLSANPAPAALLNNPLLLTDGTVIAIQQGTSNWYKLTPDVLGNYANGTWSQIASLPSGYQPIYFASAVLPDGRVIIEGGECNAPVAGCSQAVWSSLGAIYDPVTDTWTSVSPPIGPGWLNTIGPGSCNGGIGGAASIILPNGTFMLSAECAFPNVDALFDPTTLGWTATGAPVSTFKQSEQGYTLLQTGKVLTIDVGHPPNARAYDPAAGIWSSIAPTPKPLINPPSCGLFEIGPAVTRPDGTVVAFGGITACGGTTDPTGIYNPFNDTWIQGPSLPTICGTNSTTMCTLADAPAALLPNGNILFAASAGFQQTPAHWFEFTSTNAINQVVDDFYAANNSAFNYNLLVLPNGQILATFFSNYLEFYTPTGSANPAWAPIITAAPDCVGPGGSYVLSGTQLNGLSQGAAYGDDFQSATNYPLVRIANNSSGHVFYARTYGHSTMSIAPGQAGSTNFEVAANTELGSSTLYVVASGIPSVGTPVTVSSSCIAHANTHDFNGDGKSDIAWLDTNGNAAVWLMNGAQVSQVAGIGAAPTVWSVVGQRDFNGDGKCDWLWRDTGGNVAIWFFNGAQVTQSAGVGNISTAWSVVGTGDFNGDGKGDILWHDSSGNVAIWLMNGALVTQSTGVGNAPPNVWTIVGTGDFNGDGKSDILWHDTSGNVAIWFMNGTQITQVAGVGNVSTVWSIVGTGDFNGDGKSDILWRDTSGNVAIWLMNGAQVAQFAAVGSAPTSWTIVETGDFNGDGKSDILWQDTSGKVAIWLMNGTQVTQVVPVGNISTVWSIQGASAD
jgi:FG-GAP-like repeat